MSTSETITKTDLKNILEAAGNIGTVDSTDVPTVNKIAEFDSSSHMNSADMSAQDVSDFVDDLDYESEVATVVSDMVDYIVEQGTSGNWKYRKWNSGRYELTIRTSDSFAITNQLGQTYYGNKSYDISGLGILSFTNVQVTGEASGVYFGTKLEGLSTSTLQLSARASASTTVTIIHNIYIDGTWK